MTPNVILGGLSADRRLNAHRNRHRYPRACAATASARFVASLRRRR